MNLAPTTADVEVYQWVTDTRSQPWIGVAHVVTVAGNTVTLTLVVVAAVIGLLIRRHPSEAALVGLGSISGYGLMVALKSIFARDRPPAADRLIEIATHSFPSGHAMMSAICYGLLGVAAWQLSPWVRDHRWILAVVPVAVVAIGVSRIYLGVHWLTDVLAGWALGTLWVVLVVLLWRRSTPGGRLHAATSAAPRE